MKSKYLLVIGIWFNLFSCTSQTQHGFSDSYKSNFFETCFASSLGVLGAQGSVVAADGFAADDGDEPIDASVSLRHIGHAVESSTTQI